MRYAFRRRAVLALALLAGVPPLAVRAADVVAPATLVVVVSEGTHLMDIRLEDLRRLFLDEMIRDSDGNKLIPLNQVPGSPERALFDSRILGMSPDEMARFWIDRKVRGQKGAPRSIAPAANLARVVARFTGTITFLHPSDVIPGLKVVKIDGRGPADAGYALGLGDRR